MFSVFQKALKVLKPLGACNHKNTFEWFPAIHCVPSLFSQAPQETINLIYSISCYILIIKQHLENIQGSHMIPVLSVDPTIRVKTRA